jgi:nicotinamide riboside kinase
MRRIAITGPESSGKTTLCEALAAHYAAPFVEEVARDYLTGLGRAYTADDLRVIANVQHDVGILRMTEGLRRHEKVQAVMLSDRYAQAEGSARRNIPEMPLMLHDTDMITIKIWSQEKFKSVHPEILDLVERTHYDHWLLCRPDMPWQADPLRENPHDRDRLFDVYRSTLEQMGRQYTIMEGDHKQRMAAAIRVIDDLLESDPVKDREVGSDKW